MKIAAATLLILLFMFGCSKHYKYVSVDSNLTSLSSDEIELSKRFKEYWESMSSGDFETTRSIELPYLNFLKSAKWYKNFRIGGKRHYHVILKKIEYDEKDHDIAYVSTFTQFEHSNYIVKEKWIAINNTWYHSYSPSILPPVF